MLSSLLPPESARARCAAGLPVLPVLRCATSTHRLVPGQLATRNLRGPSSPLQRLAHPQLNASGRPTRHSASPVVSSPLHSLALFSTVVWWHFGRSLPGKNATKPTSTKTRRQRGNSHSFATEFSIAPCRRTRGRSHGPQHWQARKAEGRWRLEVPVTRARRVAGQLAGAAPRGGVPRWVPVEICRG
jgi:hypothetical protein